MCVSESLYHTYFGNVFLEKNIIELTLLVNCDQYIPQELHRHANILVFLFFFICKMHIILKLAVRRQVLRINVCGLL